MVPLAGNQAVCVGIMSYDGQLNFGLVGDYDGLNDLDVLADDLAAEIAELSGSRPKPRRKPKAERPKPGTKARERARSGA
jgi:hypothetical protein